MFERFTDRARRVLVLAQEQARTLNHGFIGTEHILLGLIQERDGIAAKALASFENLSIENVREKVEEIIGVASPSSSPPFTPRAKKVLELSLRQALQLGHSYIGTEHMLLGLLREGEGVGVQVLVSLGTDLNQVRQRVLSLMSGYSAIPQNQALDPRGGELGTPSPTSLSPARLIVCSFCGRWPPESGQIVAGSSHAFICEHCIRRWSLELQESTPSRSSDVVMSGGDLIRPTGPPPDNQDEARVQVAAAFSSMGTVSDDGQTLTMVQGGDQLVGARNAVIDRHGSYSLEFTIDEVVFIDAEHAVVWFTSSSDWRPLPSRHRGDAVVQDGTWKVSRSTFLELMRLAGVELPPAD